ncbi:zinc finger protein 436-like isoform X3 [Rana temporaria]|uniref:zinc finger protein 436-like isoform X3 n=1 Tax=Rana temporaria TaxID=8407 RepID=UPI001AAE12BC|nr:zinc finger protein 436-like isoform X3 [Rana temporaria]
MVKKREQLAEAVLNHALEIICLLTVEDYIIVKRPDGTRCTFNIHATEVKSNMCGSTAGYPELSFTLLGMEDKTQKKITELASKIVHLLTRKDECEYLGKQSKDNQDTCTIEQPTTPVQQSTEQSCPIRCCIKEEPQDRPHYSTEQPTSPVQQRTETVHHIKYCKVEPGEEPHHSAGWTSALPSSEFIPGSPERKPLSTVNVHLPFVEAQTTSGFNFISAYNIKLEPGGDSSGDTEDSAEEDGTSALPSEFIPERKPLSTVNVHLPFMEAQTTSGFNFPSSSDNKPEAGGESSDDTEDSADEESSQVSHSSGRKRVHSIYHLIEEEPKESQDSDMSVSEDPFGLADCTDQDEDYIPLRTTNKRARTHKSTSEKMSLSCEVCGKLLGSKRTLDKHLQIHTGERPHACDECDKRFSCQSHLDAHMRTHIGERPYKCNQCSRRFFNHQHLVLHQVVHTGEKPYSCPVCGKGFTRQSSVVKHSGIHAEQKPFVCSECGKSYCQYASLVVHQRQHSGEKPFVCKYCDQAFPCKDTMLNHQGTHTRTFPCAKCDKCFISRSSLLKHKQKVHTKETKPA